MRKVTFTANCRDGECQVTGWQLACGAVVHRRLSWRWSSDDSWSVSDPVSGCEFVPGYTIAEAVAAYRALVSRFGANWSHVLVKQRKLAADEKLAFKRRGELPACALHEAPETVQ